MGACQGQECGNACQERGTGSGCACCAQPRVAPFAQVERAWRGGVWAGGWVAAARNDQNEVLARPE
eukprot:3402899-Prymnesium_polylepis.1